MAKSRRPRRNDRSTTELTALFAELRANFSNEALGLALFLLGGFFGFTYLASTDRVAWIGRMLGSGTLLAVAGLLLMGAVLMLGERAGYWNPQAIVGGELLILGLTAFIFVQQSGVVDWVPPVDGSLGGV
ncbi:MAG: hypothetical protein WBO46_16370, partial [Caldilineaceae bacterium]